VLLLTVSGTRPPSDPVPVVRAFDAALTSHDVDTALGLFDQGAAVQVDREPQTRDQIRGWIEQLIRDDVQLVLVGEPRVGSTAGPRGGAAVSWPSRLYTTDGAWVVAGVAAVVVDDKLIFLRIGANPEPGSD
jgi:hypothetical protein